MKFQIARNHQAREIVDVLTSSISELCHADHGGSEAILNRWLRNKTIQQCQEWIEDKTKSMLVAVEKSEIAAIGQIGKDGYIYLCYVNPKRAGNGVGKELLLELEKLAKKWGLKRIRLESTATAKGFYEKQGYTLTQTGTAFGLMESFHMEKVL